MLINQDFCCYWCVPPAIMGIGTAVAILAAVKAAGLEVLFCHSVIERLES